MVKMEDSAEKKAGSDFFKGVKSEFKKIVWPDRQATIKFNRIAGACLRYGQPNGKAYAREVGLRAQTACAFKASASK